LAICTSSSGACRVCGAIFSSARGAPPDRDEVVEAVEAVEAVGESDGSLAAD
jgi:hypothetical protein